MLRLQNVRLPIGAAEASLPEVCARLLGVSPTDILGHRILRKSLDIRDKNRLENVYTIAVEAADEAALRSRRRSVKVEPFDPPALPTTRPGDCLLSHRPVVVGAGPAGLFAAYRLAELGYQPIVLERGQPVSQRVRDVAQFDAGGPADEESNYLFGEGGAGTFSDGKLTCRGAGPLVQRVLQIFADHKGKPSIVYDARPHLGSNRLPAVVKALRQAIEQMGGEFRFGCRLDDLEITAGAITALHTSAGKLPVDVALLAIGHSARDTYFMLHRRQVAMSAKPFQMGLRIEQPQAHVTQVQYGSGPHLALLGPADYTLNVHAGDRDLFTFCMCAGGYVMPSVSQIGYFCTNGMSRSQHESPFANSGLVLTVQPSDVEGPVDPLSLLRFQMAIEAQGHELAARNYLTPIQSARDYLADRPSTESLPTSYLRGSTPTNLRKLLPAWMNRLFCQGLPLMDDRWRGWFLRDATLVGPEARGSSPIRLDRDPMSLQSLNVSGLYPIGEGAGYAGGIVSAAVDGYRAADAIIRRHQPLRA